MKSILTAVLLLGLPVIVFCQSKTFPKHGEELQAGYFRETFKMRDRQVSPMMYIANLNGIRLSYARLTPKNQWLAETNIGMADLVAPQLGVRQFKFSEDQTQPLTLLPTLYRADLYLTYRRQLQQLVRRTSWAGISVQESFYYADGVAMTTWVMNTLAASFSYQTQIYLNKNNSILAEANLPVLAAISRLPYSNVVSKPGRSNAKAFLQESRVVTLNHYLHPQLSVSYQFVVSKRLAMQARYRYSWMRYPEPQVIRSASHTGNLSMIYKFHFLYK